MTAPSSAIQVPRSTLGPQRYQRIGEFGPATTAPMGRLVVDDIGQLARRQPLVQGRQHGPDLAHSIEQIAVDDTVVGQNRYPISLLHPETVAQKMGETISAGVEGRRSCNVACSPVPPAPPAPASVGPDGSVNRLHA